MFLVLFLLVIGFTDAQALYIQRYVEITPSYNQIFSDEEYGSGTFWRPSFSIEPFTLYEPGDTIEITVGLGGSKVEFIAGDTNQESLGAGIGSPGGQHTYYNATWEFLDVQGDPISNIYATNSYSEGWGIAVNFNPINLSDTSFSFGGIRYTFTILDNSILPSIFDEGFIGVQTQGSFEITQAPVPEPSTMFILGSGLLCLIGYRKKFK